MSDINNINRRKFLEIIGGCSCGLLFSSCTSAPITDRKQLKLLPESTINRQAADLYERVRKVYERKITALTKSPEFSDLSDVQKLLYLSDEN